MSQDRSRFDSNGDLDIVVPYNPNETNNPGGNSGSGSGFSTNKGTGPGSSFGGSTRHWSTGIKGTMSGFHGSLSRQEISLLSTVSHETYGLSSVANDETQRTLDNLNALIDTEVARISTGSPIDKKNAIDKLIQAKKTEIHKNIKRFTDSFGSNPINIPSPILFKTFYYNRNWRSSDEARDNLKEWDDSYRAAKSNQILERSVQILHEKSNILAKAIEQANREDAEKRAAQRAANTAAKETQRQANLLAQARQREANARAAIEVQRQRAQQQAKETARNAEAAVQVHAAIKAATVAPALTSTTTTEANRLGDRIANTLKAAALIKHLGPQMAVFAVGIGFPSELDNSERPSPIATAPVSQLDMPNSLNLRELADIRGSASVPHRLLFDRATASEPHWVPTTSAGVPSDVRVRHVLNNIQNNTYEFTRDGEDQPALIWTPVAHPANSSTYLPATPPEQPGIPGLPAHPASAELETYPEAEREFLDDYILIFPEDSGWEEQYVMFKSPRYLPGKVSGEGKSFPSNWQDLAMSDRGVPISDKVAEILAGRQYAEFRNLKRAIWRETAKIVIN